MECSKRCFFFDVLGLSFFSKNCTKDQTGPAITKKTVISDDSLQPEDVKVKRQYFDFLPKVGKPYPAFRQLFMPPEIAKIYEGKNERGKIYGK